MHIECEKDSIVYPTAFNLSLTDSIPIPQKSKEVLVRNGYLITITQTRMYFQRKSVNKNLINKVTTKRT